MFYFIISNDFMMSAGVKRFKYFITLQKSITSTAVQYTFDDFAILIPHLDVISESECDEVLVRHTREFGSLITWIARTRIVRIQQRHLKRSGVKTKRIDIPVEDIPNLTTTALGLIDSDAVRNFNAVRTASAHGQRNSRKRKVSHIIIIIIIITILLLSI